MKNSNPPAFQLYPTQDLSDLSACHIVAEGMYSRLRNLCWIRGALPAPRRELARLAQVSPQTFEKYWPEIQHLFDRRGAFVVVLALEKERHKQKRNRRARQLAGIIGAEVRWNGQPPRGRRLFKILFKVCLDILHDGAVLAETRGDPVSMFEVFKQTCGKLELPYAPDDDPGLARRVWNSATSFEVRALRRRIKERGEQ